jgi:hypothetical protein
LLHLLTAITLGIILVVLPLSYLLGFDHDHDGHTHGPSADPRPHGPGADETHDH